MVRTSKSNACRIEKGHGKPGPTLYPKIAGLLGLPVEQVIQYYESDPPRAM